MLVEAKCNLHVCYIVVVVCFAYYVFFLSSSRKQNMYNSCLSVCLSVYVCHCYIRYSDYYSEQLIPSQGPVASERNQHCGGEARPNVRGLLVLGHGVYCPVPPPARWFAGTL